MQTVFLEFEIETDHPIKRPDEENNYLLVDFYLSNGLSNKIEGRREAEQICCQRTDKE